MPLELSTSNQLSFNFYSIKSDIFKFKVKAPHDAHIILSTTPTIQNPSYHIIIGGWKNSKTVIRKNEKDDVATTTTNNILASHRYQGFWISFQHGKTISVGHEHSSSPFIIYNDPNCVHFSYVGVSTGWGASGQWSLDLPPISGSWQNCSNGSAPYCAFVAAVDHCGRKYHVIRGWYNNALLPGKLVPGHNSAYVAWDGLERACSQYEVLCDFNGYWQQCRNSHIPSNAFPAGKSEKGETLYVGKVFHNGEVCIGKVQPSHGCCYIPYGGKEITYSEFEILIG